MLIAFWIFSGLLVYSYVVYPLALVLASLFLRRSHEADDGYLPEASIIIPAHNERDVIASKIENCLKLDYPREKLEIIVASDASTDDTAEIARGFAKDGVIVLDSTPRRGKMAVLNATVPKARSEIIVLTDANAMFKEDALKKMVRHFADARIGCVCGAKRIVEGRSEIGHAEGFYWKYENLVKTLESRIGSCAGADGSIYALRRSLYPFPREDRAIMDDLAVSLKVVEKGFRVVFEKEASAFETASVRIPDEFRRKARILSGALVAVGCARRLLIPGRSPVWIQLYSHKFVRWAGGLLLAGVLLANLFLLGHFFYRMVLILQFLCYSLALAGFVLQAKGKRSGKIHIIFYFVLTNVAQVAGLVRYCLGREKGAWERLEREAA
jgi:biofilm PGA synthesis N-glycosyltransferase PgaC